MLKFVSNPSNLNQIPILITEDIYNEVKTNKSKYLDWYVGLIGFCGSFGAKFFGGYARNSRGDNSGKRSMSAIKNLINQSNSLSDIKFDCKDFLDIDISAWKNCVIYCDPPYKNTTQYKINKNFPYDNFYEWCKALSKNNIVLISEYNMPEEFTCIWQKDVYTTLSINNYNNKTERMFIV